MKTSFTVLGRTLLLLACATLPAGCLHEKLVWSPDGNRAAVITTEGLHICTAEGTLSRLLLPRVYRAAWLADSQRLVIAQTRPVHGFQDLARALGPARTRELTLKAESIWQRWEASPGGNSSPPPIKPDSDGGGIVLYLREHHRDRLKEKSAAHWKGVETLSAEWHTLTVVRLTADGLQTEATLYEGLSKVNEARPAPDGRSVAFVRRSELSPDSDDGFELFLSPVSGDAPARLIASQISGFPDWAADGLTLFCLKGASRTPSGSELRLGTLAAYKVLDPDGKIATDAKANDLAGLIFHDGSRIRGLRDGRVLFNAVEFNLPMATDETDLQEEFFVVDPALPNVMRLVPRDALTGLPKSLAHFEPSPDGSQILVSDDSGKVWLVTLADRKVALLCEGFGKEDSIAPAWRLAGEFTYRKPSAPRHDLIQREGTSESVLSRTWPAEVLARLVK